MKTIIRSVLASLFVTAVILLPVAAGHFWSFDVSTPSSITNKDQVQLDYTVLSTSNSDEINVELLRNSVLVDSDTITNGNDSGRLIAPLPNDGTFTLEIKAQSTHEDPIVKTRTVTRDTTPPATPNYIGFSRSNNQYTVNFAATDTDTARIYLFSSTNRAFTANADTLIGFVAATGNNQQITYTASISAERFHAIVAVDQAGNISPAVGDPDVQVEIEEGIVPAPGVVPVESAPGENGEIGEGIDTGATDDSEDSGIDSDGDEDVLAEADDRSSWWWLLPIAILFFAILFARRRKGNKTGLMDS